MKHSTEDALIGILAVVAGVAAALILIALCVTVLTTGMPS